MGTIPPAAPKTTEPLFISSAETCLAIEDLHLPPNENTATLLAKTGCDKVLAEIAEGKGSTAGTVSEVQDIKDSRAEKEAQDLKNFFGEIAMQYGIQNPLIEINRNLWSGCSITVSGNRADKTRVEAFTVQGDLNAGDDVRNVASKFDQQMQEKFGTPNRKSVSKNSPPNFSNDPDKQATATALQSTAIRPVSIEIWKNRLYGSRITIFGFDKNNAPIILTGQSEHALILGPSIDDLIQQIPAQ